MTRAFETCFKYTDFNGSPIERASLFQRERTTGPSRIAFGPANSCAPLVRELVTMLSEPVFLLFVLTASRRGRRLGRYQSSLMSKQEADAFVAEFGEFLDRDARQHFWIGSADGSGTIVWDPHQIVYAYGDIDQIEAIAHRLDFSEGPVDIAAPHCHQFHALFDDTEEEILDRFEWHWSELHDGDE